MNQSALLVIDMQRFFFEENPALKASGVIESCAKIIKTARKKGIPVLHIQTLYAADKSDWPKVWTGDACWCSNFIEGKETARQLTKLDIGPDEVVIIKKRYSAFYNTNLDAVLQHLGVDHLYLVGYAADVCVRLTAMDGYNRGYRLTLIREGIEPFKETKEASIAYLEWLADAKTVSQATCCS